MSNNQKVGQGALFKNDKQGNEKRPDYTGTLKIWDKEFFVSAWIQTSKNGVKYMGLAVNPKESSSEPAQQNASAQNNQSAPSAAVDDEIPF